MQPILSTDERIAALEKLLLERVAWNGEERRSDWGKKTTPIRDLVYLVMTVGGLLVLMAGLFFQVQANTQALAGKADKSEVAVIREEVQGVRSTGNAMLDKVNRMAEDLAWLRGQAEKSRQ